MNLKSVFNNLVIIFGENISSTLALDPINLKIQTIYSTQNPNPVIAKFPELTAITVPETQLSLVFQSNSFIITDQNIGTFSNKDTRSFIRLGKETQNIINKPIIAFGFNFAYDLEDSNFHELTQKLKSSFFKSNLSTSLPRGVSLNYVLPVISFKDSNSKIGVKFNEVIENPQAEEADRLRVNVNVHFNNQTVPELDQLLPSYQEKQEFISNYLIKLFE